MRFELSGTMLRPEPISIHYSSDDSFDPTNYIANGYLYFDVICIGAGGGRGGGINTENTGTLIRNFGGEGGGGGLHRVQGLLSGLSTAVPIVVGSAGADGLDHASNPASTTDGGDGHYSSFNGTMCCASGGKGGGRAQSNSETVTTQAHGGDGGIGGRTTAGGGAAGGTAGTPANPGPGVAGTDGADGTWNGIIGSGGGGGAGGVGKYGSGGVTLNLATSGGRGSFNAADQIVSAPGGVESDDGDSGATSIVPGDGGGGKGFPLTGLPTIFGSSGHRGIVVLRLTADVLSGVVNTGTTPPIEPPPPPPPPPPPATPVPTPSVLAALDWTITFDEEFEGSSVNAAVWSQEDGWTDKNNCTIHAYNEVVDNGIYYGKVPVLGSGAEICTIDNMFDVNCVVEAKLWVPGVSNKPYNWPAFWVSGPGWPNAGEIDIFECVYFAGLGAVASVNYHYQGDTGVVHDNDPSPKTGTWCGRWITVTCQRLPTQAKVWWDQTLARTIDTHDNGAGQNILLTAGQDMGTAVLGDAGTIMCEYIRMWTPA